MMNYRVLELTRQQSLHVRRLISYMDYDVYPYLSSNLTISTGYSYQVTGTTRSPTSKYTINEFLKDLHNGRKKV